MVERGWAKAGWAEEQATTYREAADMLRHAAQRQGDGTASHLYEAAERYAALAKQMEMFIAAPAGADRRDG